MDLDLRGWNPVQGSRPKGNRVNTVSPGPVATDLRLGKGGRCRAMQTRVFVHTRQACPRGIARPAASGADDHERQRPLAGRRPPRLLRSFRLLGCSGC